jgi:glucose-6-phosphate 1-dehydrogenase
MSERPDYEILGVNSSNIEIRKYSRLIWANAASFGKINQIDSTRFELFNKLFGYLNGQNDMGAKINMTSPVTMCFFTSNS